jgi:hypothetical protein
MPALFYSFERDIATYPAIYNYSIVLLPCGLRPPNPAKDSVHFPMKHLWLATSDALNLHERSVLRHFHYRPSKSFAWIIMQGSNLHDIAYLAIALPFELIIVFDGRRASTELRCFLGYKIFFAFV